MLDLEKNNNPIWKNILTPQFPSLTHNVHTTACVIGGGISGMTTAYLLRKAGMKVTVLENSHIGGGETLRTSAHLSYALDEPYQNLIETFGVLGAIRAAESHKAAIDFIEKTILRESIECDFSRVSGYLFQNHNNNDNSDFLQKELQAAHRARLFEVTFKPEVLISPYYSSPALHYPNQAQFHPIQYLLGLTHAFTEAGGTIYNNTHATHIHGQNPATIETSDGAKVFADFVVVATNVPFDTKLSIHTKQAAYRSYVVGALIPSNTIEKALFWDTEDPYHYIRLQPQYYKDSDLLIIGGEDHKSGQGSPEDKFFELEAWSREIFPEISKFEFHWSGQIIEPSDGLAYIGHHPGQSKSIFVITGDSGNGLTHGTIGGMLVSDLILDNDNRWKDLYDPNRFSIGGLKDYFLENVNSAIQYSDWITAGDVKSIEDIKYGSGAVIRDGIVKLAVYRDNNGEVFECSASCPHLGGIVRWNETEKTWDCPCHGSRFDCYGKVLNGPSPVGLAQVNKTKSKVLQNTQGPQPLSHNL